MQTQVPEIAVVPASPMGGEAAALRVRRQLMAWLGGVAVLLLVMIMLGGLTRLTHSGLSITEWKPVTGAVPPLSESAWQSEFEKYQQIPEYKIINKGMTLQDFKGIYWWEWTHRLVGRLLGFVFIGPFLYFIFTRKIDRQLVPRLGLIALLGAGQGALGWFMVMSGLVHRTDVSQYRLAAHLALAFTIFGAVVWTIYDLNAKGRARVSVPATTRSLAFAYLALLACQIVMGAFVAGLDAGFAYNTWPLMDGRIIPPGMGFIFEETTAAQFTHRMIAYLVLAVAAAIFWQARGLTGPASRSGKAVLHATLLQVALGIATLVTVVALPLAAAHQLCAALLLAVGLYHLHTVTARAPQP